MKMRKNSSKSFIIVIISLRVELMNNTELRDDQPENYLKRLFYNQRINLRKRNILVKLKFPYIHRRERRDERRKLK